MAVVDIELDCPACRTVVSESFDLHFTPTGDENTDHNARIAEEARFVRSQQEQCERGDGSPVKYIPSFFKEHIKSHEEWAFKSGAVSRDPEIRKRIEELNSDGESIVAELTMEILTKRQQECGHDFERRWLPASEVGKLNLLCSGCFKVLNVKFVGTSTQHGETIGLKIVTEK
ncbi:MAG: hypothetical protein WA192_05920 [Candidatus Acidiferrales bacterium]